MKRKIYLYLCTSFIMLGCSSSQLVENWKNPTINTFEAQKVFVIGITANLEHRRVFEQRLTSTLKKSDINAVKSLDFFDKFYTTSPKTENELMTLESELIEEGFDAILLSKVVGIEDKVTVVKAYRNADRAFQNFKEDYYENQEIFQKEDYYEAYQVFHAESSLYCICPEKEKELIWKGSIDITEPENIKKAVNDYIKILVWTLKEQRLLIIEDEENENLNI